MVINFTRSKKVEENYKSNEALEDSITSSTCNENNSKLRTVSNNA